MPPPLTPDYEKFVASLSDEQATFLHVQLQGVRGQRVIPLREAVMNRVLDSEDKVGQARKMYHNYYRPTIPVVAIPVNGPHPVKKRR